MWTSFPWNSLCRLAHGANSPGTSALRDERAGENTLFAGRETVSCTGWKIQRMKGRACLSFVAAKAQGAPDILL
jgi:hypothetical protein